MVTGVFQVISFNYDNSEIHLREPQMANRNCKVGQDLLCVNWWRSSENSEVDNNCKAGKGLLCVNWWLTT